MKNETEALNQAIIALQKKRAMELWLLNEQFDTTYESLKPINLLKSTFMEVSASSDIKSNILANAIGLGTGFLTKKLLVGKSHSPFKILLGTLIQFAIANVVSNHADDIKTVGENLLHRFSKSGKNLKEN